MNVIAINSSPRGQGESKTEMILKPLVEGMEAAGARVDLVNLREKKVRNCIGCFTCFTKTPGACVHQDDMTKEIFPKWLDADLAVYATPLYHYTVNATMKAFIERTLPVLEPFFEEKDGRMHHPRRHPASKAVVMSVAGFPEMAVFDQLSAYVRFIFGKNLLAEIYRPAAESLAYLPDASPRDAIFDALRKAGGELVRSQAVSPDTLEQITQPLGIESTFALVGNAMWKTCIEEKVTPREMRERGIAPRPDSIETFMLLMPMGFQPETAGDLNATFQFDFSGEENGSCHLAIANGKIAAVAGAAPKSDITIKTPFGLWMDIMTGKADGQQALMDQKYNVEGDFSLLLKLGSLFGKA
jgi:multimeric flavodoxin WrbA